VVDRRSCSPPSPQGLESRNRPTEPNRGSANALLLSLPTPWVDHTGQPVEHWGSPGDQLLRCSFTGVDEPVAVRSPVWHTPRTRLHFDAPDDTWSPICGRTLRTAAGDGGDRPGWWRPGQLILADGTAAPEVLTLPAFTTIPEVTVADPDDLVRFHSTLLTTVITADGQLRVSRTHPRRTGISFDVHAPSPHSNR
jgi:hypothetical protein